MYERPDCGRGAIEEFADLGGVETRVVGQDHRDPLTVREPVEDIEQIHVCVMLP